MLNRKASNKPIPSFHIGKRGISAVVATVLIIMITVATVAIVWAFIIPMIKDVLIESTSEKAELSIETDGGYTTWDEVQKIARVQVKRGNDKLNLTGIDFSFIKQGNTEKRTNETVPQKNQLKVYEFNLSDFGKPEEIKIAPITAAGVGEVVSESDVINNYSGGSSVCVPDCDGKVCDEDGDGCGNSCVEGSGCFVVIRAPISSSCEVNSDCDEGSYCKSGFCGPCAIGSELRCARDQTTISVFEEPDPGCPIYRSACCGDNTCRDGVENITNCPEDCS